MNMKTFVYDIRELLAEPILHTVSDDDIETAVESSLRRYSADTRFFKGDFEIKENLEFKVRAPKMTDFWWGMGRNLGWPIVPMPPQASTLPLGNGYPYPLKEPEDLNWGYTSRFHECGLFSYPEDFIQILFGDNPNAQTIRAVHSYDDEGINDYPVEISDDLSNDGYFTVNPKKIFQPNEPIVDDSGLGTILSIDGFEYDDEYGIPCGDFGTLSNATVQEIQGGVRYIRICKINEIRDSLSICFYALYLLLQNRTERIDMDRSQLFRRLYESRIGRIRILERKMCSVTKTQGIYF